MKYFEHDYLIPDEFRADATILCMRCARAIASPSYRTMAKKNEPGKTVYVYDRKIHSDYRTVVIELRMGERKGSMTIAVCADCVNFKLEDNDKVLIKNQILRAMEMEHARNGASPEAAAKALEGMKAQEIIGRQEGT